MLPITRRTALRRALRSAAALPAVHALLRAQQHSPSPHPSIEGATILPLLPPREGNPRNTEGAFVTLRDGRILFAYTKFTGGTSDHAAATIVARTSADGGRTWTADDAPLIEREGDMNVMSVSLLRLRDGRIALFYLRKNSTIDCHPYLRTSTDEGTTWSEPTLCIPEEGYWVLNNDRVVELGSGRLVMPVALHSRVGDDYNPRGVAMTYMSDDSGRTWRRTRTILECPEPSRAGFQEPGVVELKDGRLMMFIRTRLGCQYLSYSNDNAETWSPAKRSEILSPQSPASVKRIPSTGDLVMVWNDHQGMPAEYLARDADPGGSGGKRTPLTLAISKDEGRTWTHRRNLMTDPEGWYCYTAIHFDKQNILLGYVSGGGGLPHLSKTDIALVPIAALYQ